MVEGLDRSQNPAQSLPNLRFSNELEADEFFNTTRCVHERGVLRL